MYFFYPLYQAAGNPDKGLEILIRRYNIHGVDAARMQAGTLVFNEQFGYAGLDNGGSGVPLSGKHHMRAESISKTVAAAAVMHLVEHSGITRNDPIYKHIEFRLPPPEKNGVSSVSDVNGDSEKRWCCPEEITIAHILSHQSGITGGTDYRVPPFEVPEREEVLAGKHRLDPAVMVRPAGEKFEYSNQAFILLEILIEQHSNKTYEEYVEANLFEPLGMEKSTYEYPAETIITSYNLKGERVPRHRYPYSAPGGLYTDAREVLLFYHNLFEGEFFSPEKAAVLTEKHTGAAGFYALGADGVGLGLFLDGDAVFHGGEGSGSLSMAFYFPETRDGFVLMTNDKTAWEFLYYAGAIMARELGHGSPRMSFLLFTGAVGFHAVMSLLAALTLCKVSAMVIGLKRTSSRHVQRVFSRRAEERTYGQKARERKDKQRNMFRPRFFLRAFLPIGFLLLWMVIRNVFIRNLAYTLSARMTAVLAVFAMVHIAHMCYMAVMTNMVYWNDTGGKDAIDIVSLKDDIGTTTAQKSWLRKKTD